LGTPQDDVDASAARRELHGVRHDIPHHLLQSIRRPLHRTHFGKRGDEGDVFSIRRGPDDVQRSVYNVPQSDGAHFQAQTTSDDARKIQQVVHEPGLYGGAVHDCGDRTLPGPRVKLGPL
jgi:hypothetical protein